MVLSGRDRSSIHRPELCLWSQGWTIRGRETQRFALPGGSELPVTLLHVEREVQPAASENRPGRGRRVPQLVAYVFIGGDRAAASHWERLALDAWQRAVHGRVDRWAYVLLQTDASDGEAAARARLQAVCAGVWPALCAPAVKNLPASGKNS